MMVLNWYVDGPEIPFFAPTPRSHAGNCQELYSSHRSPGGLVLNVINPMLRVYVRAHSKCFGLPASTISVLNGLGV